ncbi:helix-turn-helix domain-containing protein [Mucilaginibacter kameinonensis]|uniref:helix-turn-helix domain-containing protein n=1 Tax=Mucilaginibacter kameinonensis TaxID=452286 RepID=UPI000EF7B7CC|nr:helix-turn-helix domain-containing protein [Mucilaginibacter kameinonensis]
MNTETIEIQKKSLALLAKQAADQLGVLIDDLKDVSDDRRKPTERRYITFALMEKAGYTHQEIADFFNMNRENITKALSKLKAWLKLYADLRGDHSRLLLTIL